MNIGDLSTIALVFVVVTVVIAVGLDVVTDVRDDFTANSAEINATNEGIDAIANLSEKLPILATAVILAVIVGVLLKVFRVV